MNKKRLVVYNFFKNVLNGPYDEDPMANFGPGRVLLDFWLYIDYRFLFKEVDFDYYDAFLNLLLNPDEAFNLKEGYINKFYTSIKLYYINKKIKILGYILYPIFEIAYNLNSFARKYFRKKIVIFDLDFFDFTLYALFGYICCFAVYFIFRVNRFIQGLF